MDATVNQVDGKRDAAEVRRLVDGLRHDAETLGKKDDASRSVRDGVRALGAAINGGEGTIAATLLALEGNVDRLHMSHMRPFFKQTLRALRTALALDVQYPSIASVANNGAATQRTTRPASFVGHSRDGRGSSG